MKAGGRGCPAPRSPADPPAPGTHGRAGTCGRPPAPGYAPFCSQGCRDRDLLNWLGDGYAIAGPPADELSEDGLDREG